MRIQFESIYLPSFLPESGSQLLGNFRGHVVRHMETLSQYVRYNELTFGGSLLVINLGFMALAEKVMKFAPEAFKKLLETKPRLYNLLVLTFEAAVTGVGATWTNQTLNLQMDPLLVAISVAASMVLKRLWVHFIAPELTSFWKGDHKDPEVFVDQPNDQSSSDDVTDPTRNSNVVDTQQLEGNSDGTSSSTTTQSTKEAEENTIVGQDTSDDILDDGIEDNFEITSNSNTSSANPKPEGAETVLNTERLNDMSWELNFASGKNKS